MTEFIIGFILGTLAGGFGAAAWVFWYIFKDWRGYK